MSRESERVAAGVARVLQSGRWSRGAGVAGVFAALGLTGCTAPATSAPSAAVEPSEAIGEAAAAVAGTSTACTMSSQCDDGNPCTKDTCSTSTRKCTYKSQLEGYSCANKCLTSGAGVCRSGVCKGTSAAVTCTPGPCQSFVACVPSLGCTYATNTAKTGLACDDKNACTTGDKCSSAGVCKGIAKASGSSCSDGNPCNGAEVCSAGVCAAGTPLSCDDQNPCTLDACSATAGCTHSAARDGAPAGGAASCSTGKLGVCATGTASCSRGALVCSAARLPAASDATCDGLDDDCDGRVDEDALRCVAAPRRIVAIGDLHGTLAAAEATLQLAGVLDAGGTWIGGDTLVVQVGDEIDRGDEDREVVDLFERLRSQGHAAPMLGNHEILNAEGSMTYVSAASFSAFADVGGRVKAMAPGGAYARIFANRKVIQVIDGNVFVHGGVLPAHVSYGVARLNDETARWLLGQGTKPALLDASDGPTWTRLYAQSPTASACTTLNQALTALGAKRMVVGHTTQSGGITAYCSVKLIAIDIGMYSGATPQVLDIQGDELSILE